MQPNFPASAMNRVTDLASRRPVHAAFSWFHNHPKIILDWQSELTAVPAPPFGEQARGKWMADLFRQIGLSAVRTDALGNVFGTLAADLPPESTGPVVILSAHLDTVFPAETHIAPRKEGDRLLAPGICDNGAGLAGLLAMAQAMIHAEIHPSVPLIFLANVGEEGEGDLRGIRYFYAHDPLAGRVVAHIVLDGAGAETAVTRALGSLRFRVSITGPGGHSFSNAGTPNPITALSIALTEMAQLALPEDPRTTFNIGTIQGGTSVNAIPQSVQATIDFRSTSTDELKLLETALHNAMEKAVRKTNSAAPPYSSRGPLNFSMTEIGNRPAALLPSDSALYETLLAVDRHLGLRTESLLGSTDANIPLARGVFSLSIGAGGDGGGAHTLEEWYCDKDRDLGLRRVLLLTLAMTEWASKE